MQAGAEMFYYSLFETAVPMPSRHSYQSKEVI